MEEYARIMAREGLDLPSWQGVADLASSPSIRMVRRPARSGRPATASSWSR